MEENLRNKTLYKVFLILLKYIPFITAVLYVINLIFSYIGIELVILSYICSVSLIPFLFMYIAAYVFRFCIYHRIFLDYTVVSNGIAVYDYYIGVPISTTGIITLQLVLFFVVLVVALILHLREKRHAKVT